MKLDWQFDYTVDSLTRIAITGEKTMLRLTYYRPVSLWKCEAVYTRTCIGTISIVAVCTNSDEMKAINGCIVDVIDRAIHKGINDKANEFDFVAEFI